MSLACVRDIRIVDWCVTHGEPAACCPLRAALAAEQEKNRAPGDDDLMESLLVADSPLGTDALKTLAAAYRSSQARIRELESMERQCIDARLEKEQSRVKELEAGMKNLFTPEEVDAICARRLEAELKKRDGNACRDCGAVGAHFCVGKNPSEDSYSQKRDGREG